MKKLMLLIGVITMLSSTSCIKGPTSTGTSSTTYHGKIVVTNIESGKTTYTDDEASVTVWIPNLIEPKFDIVFNGVKFAEAMPIKLNLELTGIPFTTTISEDETTLNYVFDSENIIPTGFDEKYLINRVWGCIGKTIDIRFRMDSYESEVTFTSGQDVSAAE